MLILFLAKLRETKRIPKMTWWIHEIHEIFSPWSSQLRLLQQRDGETSAKFRPFYLYYLSSAQNCEDRRLRINVQSNLVHELAIVSYWHPLILSSFLLLSYNEPITMQYSSALTEDPFCDVPLTSAMLRNPNGCGLYL